MNRFRNKGILSFLIICFAIAWGVWGALYVAGIEIGTPVHGAIGLIAVFAPAIAGFITRKFITQEGFSDIGWNLNLKKWPIYLFAWLWTLGLAFLTAGLAWSLGLIELNFDVSKAVVGTPMAEQMQDIHIVTFVGMQLIAAIPSTLVLFGEEFGWRGFLQKKIYPHSLWKSSIVVGLIWGAWHFPVNLQGFNYPEHKMAGLLVFPVAGIFTSYIFMWIYQRAQSIWAVCLTHASFNSVAGSFIMILYLDKSNLLMTSIVGVSGICVLAALCLVLHLIDHKRSRVLE